MIDNLMNTDPWVIAGVGLGLAGAVWILAWAAYGVHLSRGLREQDKADSRKLRERLDAVDVAGRYGLDLESEDDEPPAGWGASAAVRDLNEQVANQTRCLRERAIADGTMTPDEAEHLAAMERDAFRRMARDMPGGYRITRENVRLTDFAAGHGPVVRWHCAGCGERGEFPRPDLYAFEGPVVRAVREHEQRVQRFGLACDGRDLEFV